MIHRSFFISIFTLLKGICCPAQIPGNFAKETIKSLQSKGADSILDLSTDLFGPGGVTYEDSLTCELPHYLFWKQDGKAFSKKLTQCHTSNFERKKIIHSSIVNISARSIYDFLAKQLDSINDRDVAPLIYKKVHNGRELYEIGYKSHSVIFRLAIYVGDKVIYKSVDPDNLQKHYVYPQFKNLNYSYNQSTAIGKFIDMIDRKIKELEEKKIYTF